MKTPGSDSVSDQTGSIDSSEGTVVTEIRFLALTMDSLPLSFGKVVVKSGATARIAATARAVSPVASTSAVRPSPLVPLPAYAAQLPGPSAGSEGRAAEEGEDSSDSEEYSDDEVEDEARTGVSELQRAVRDLPVTHEIVLKEHTKVRSSPFPRPARTGADARRRLSRRCRLIRRGTAS